MLVFITPEMVLIILYVWRGAPFRAVVMLPRARWYHLIRCLERRGGGTNTGWTLSDKAVKSYKKYMYWFINNKKWTFRYRNESFKDRFWFFVCSGCYQPLKLFLTVCGYRTTWRIHWVHISSNMKTKHDTSEHVKSVQIEKKINFLMTQVAFAF